MAKQIRLSDTVHRQLKRMSADTGETMEYLAELFIGNGIKSHKESLKIKRVKSETDGN